MNLNKNSALQILSYLKVWTVDLQVHWPLKCWSQMKEESVSTQHICH